MQHYFIKFYEHITYKINIYSAITEELYLWKFTWHSFCNTWTQMLFKSCSLLPDESWYLNKITDRITSSLSCLFQLTREPKSRRYRYPAFRHCHFCSHFDVVWPDFALPYASNKCLAWWPYIGHWEEYKFKWQQKGLQYPQCLIKTSHRCRRCQATDTQWMFWVGGPNTATYCAITSSVQIQLYYKPASIPQKLKAIRQ